MGKRIGIMGGTFDPIHYGHLVLAEQVRQQHSLDEIVFIPLGVPPHKNAEDITDGLVRFQMTQLAIEDNEKFSISPIEINRQQTTYTVDTILELKKIYDSSTQLFFITGADAIIEMETWKRYKKLMELCSFIAATRPSVDLSHLKTVIATFDKKYGASISIAKIPALEISSTAIRKKVSNNESIRYLLPDQVIKFISDNKLYRNK